jgi:DNA-binding NarL/FixJ family response regulator
MNAAAPHLSIDDAHRVALRRLCDAFAEQLHRGLVEVVDAALQNAGRTSEPPAPTPPALGWADPGSTGTLSARENEVLACLAAGDSNKAIARALGLSPHTVKRHVANILNKLGASSRVQAVARRIATRH